MKLLERPDSALKRSVSAAPKDSRGGYINALSDFSPSSRNHSELAALYRLNGAKMGMLEELVQLNSSLPKMKDGCELAIIMPAFNEEMCIARSLSSLVSQVDSKGNPLDPELFEVLILINRPNDSVAWDRTRERAMEFAADNPAHNIHVLLHSFNFPTETKEVELNGTSLNIPQGVKMGLIMKLLADLALVRGIEIGQDILIHPAGADVHSRSPFFIRNVIDSFSNGDDFLKLSFMIPTEVCRHMPLLWALHRYRMALATEYFGVQNIKRHGVFRASAYARAGGFHPNVGVGEDTEFGNRLRNCGAKIVCSDGPLVADNPRRSIATILGGKVLVLGYSGFALEDSPVRALSLQRFLSSRLPDEAEFTKRNFSKHASGHFRHYIRKAMKKAKGNFKEGFGRARECTGRAMERAGFEKKDFTLVMGKAPPWCKVEIKRMANILEKFEKEMEGLSSESW